MKKTLLSILFISITTLSSAQYGPVKNTVIPPSPTSSTFRQFAGYTPSLATGSVNIPIDLYEIKVGNFSLPISLQYYTSGIKFTDTPYPAGYGWVLSPGLRITRTIMGRPDRDFANDARISGAEEMDFTYLKKALHQCNRDHGDIWNNINYMIDTQHDIYTLHLPHGNYTFLLDKINNAYVAVTAGNILKIVPQGDPAGITAGFEVTDENGVIYHFGTTSQVTATSADRELLDNQFITAWMLKRIVLPGSGNQINFTWESASQSKLGVFGPYFGSNVIIDNKSLNYGGTETHTNPELTSAVAEGILDNDAVRYTDMSQLKQISFATGTVNFTYRAWNNPLITNITVKNIYNSIVKTADFTYGTGFDERLLQSVKLSGEGTYGFQYNPKRHNTVGVNAQDYWGYYNEKSNNSLVPQMEVYTYGVNGSPYGYQPVGQADRSINANAMKACILTKVTYPTGGHSAFEYEPHRFPGVTPTSPGLSNSSKITLEEGGGLRVTKVTTTASDSSPAVVKTYKYGSAENGKANVINVPTMDTFIDEYSGFDAFGSGFVGTGATCRVLYINPHSNYMKYSFNTPNLWYSTVTEYVNNESKTEYTFSRIAENNEYSSVGVKDFAQKTIFNLHTLFSKGCILTKEIQYLKTGTTYSPQQQIVYNYTKRGTSNLGLVNLFVTRIGINLMNGPDFNRNALGRVISPLYGELAQDPLADYTKYNYRVSGYYEELTSKVVTTYGSSNMTQRTDYIYASLQLRSQSTTQSNGYTQKEEYWYPVDHAQASTTAQKTLLQTMLGKNMRSMPFKVIRTVNGNTTEQRTEFKHFGNNIYLPEKEYFKKGSAAEVCNHVFDYDARGNLRSVTQNGALKTTYLWGYDYAYPVAMIEGLNYAETLAIVGQTNINNLNTGNVSTVCNTIRTQLNGKGLMTSYIWTPLVGITSVTNPQGNRTSYTYDNVGRLTYISDRNNKPMQRFYYHYNNDSAFTVTFAAQSIYAAGATLNTSATATGGSGDYRYVWTLKNSSGTVLYTSAESTSYFVSIPLPSQTGTMTLTCTVTDTFVGGTATYSRSFTVSNPVIRFSDVSQGNGYASGTIDCAGTCTVSFYMNASVSGDGYAQFYLGGEYHTVYGYNGTSASVTLSSGSYSFSVQIMDSYGGDSAGIYINGVSAGYTTGSPSSIQANN